MALRRKLALLITLAVTAASVPVFGFELLYRWLLRDVKVARWPQGRAPPLITKALWVEEGEQVGAGVERVWLGSILRMRPPAGFRGADRVALHLGVGFRHAGCLERSALAILLTRRYGEDELARVYAQTAYFGRRATGVDAASWAYFGRPASSLDVAEVAALVALTKYGGSRDPYCEPELWARRRRWAIEKMLGAGLISLDDASRARDEDVRVTPVGCERPPPSVDDDP